MTNNRSDPLMDKGVRGLIFNMAKDNYWKVAKWQDLDDLVQDGFIAWFKVRRRYPEITDIRHLTALFKTTFYRHIVDLANKRTEGEEVVFSQIMGADTDATMELEKLLGSCDEEATLTVLLHSAPEELRQLWRMLKSDYGRLQLQRPYRREKGRVCETTNEFLCRIMGFDPAKVNLEAMARKHFLGVG